MGSVYTDYEHLWNVTSTADRPVTDEETLAYEAARIGAVRDARIATGTQFFKEFEARLDRQIALLAPDPRGGSDVAACMAFKRAGLEEAKSVLALMVRLAQEKIPNE